MFTIKKLRRISKPESFLIYDSCWVIGRVLLGGRGEEKKRKEKNKMLELLLLGCTGVVVVLHGANFFFHLLCRRIPLFRSLRQYNFFPQTFFIVPNHAKELNFANSNDLIFLTWKYSFTSNQWNWVKDSIVHFQKKSSQIPSQIIGFACSCWN